MRVARFFRLSRPWPLFALLMLCGTGFVATAGSKPIAAPDDDPMLPLEWLVGTWQAEFLPHGPERAAPTMTMEWGPQRAYLRMLGTQPGPDGRLVPEHETFIVWNPVTLRLELLGTYHGSAGTMLETGHVEPLDDGGLVLHMDVHYSEGETLPFSDGAVAGRGGHTLQFRRTLRPDEADGLVGTFFLKRGGRWENPHPDLGLDSYPWSRIAGAGDPTMPAWAREHLEGQVTGSGRWIASNAAYQSAEEPADAYGTEWHWTLGRQGVRGRLFGLRDGEETGTFWEFHTYWHPGERRLVAAQYGGDGTVAEGTVVHRGGNEIEIDQTFYRPDGSSYRTLHRTTHEPARQVGTSFDRVDGEWQPRRTYTWELAPGSSDAR